MTFTDLLLLSLYFVLLLAEKNMYDICGNFTKLVTDVVYLMYGSKFFQECLCFVNRGKFLMILSDIRLMERKQDKCSPAKLHMNEREIFCDDTKDDLGSVFNKSIQEPIENAYISVVLNSESRFPDNVLVTLKPGGKHGLFLLTEFYTSSQ